MTMYCELCKRPVNPTRRLTTVDVVLLIFTGGAWVFALFFKKKSCPICKGYVLSNRIGAEEVR